MQEVATCTRTALGRVEDLGEPHLDSDVGSEVYRVTLTSPKHGISVTVNSLGCRVESVKLGKGGEMLSGSFPAVLGRVHLAGKYRVALRKGGEAEYDNEGAVGTAGFDQRNWKLTNTFSSQKGARAVFELESADMDQGHPGAVRIEAHISALEDGASGLCRLEIRYRARLAVSSPSDAYCNLVPQLPFQCLDGGDCTLWLPSSGSDCAYAMPSRLQALSGEGEDEGQVFALHASNETKIAAEVVGPKGTLAVRTTLPSLRIATTASSVTLQPHYAPDQLLESGSGAHLKGTPGQGNGLFRRLVSKNRPTDSAFAAPDEYAFEYDELVGFEFKPSLFA